MFSSGQRSLLGEVLSWVFLAVVAVGCVTHFEELTAVAHQVAGSKPGILGLSRDAGTDADARGSAASDTQSSDGYTVEIPVGPDGHYHAEAEINGRGVQVLVDTGASVVALTAEDAETAGIFVTDRDFTGRIQTANGTGRVAPVVLDEVTIGDITVRDVRAVVTEAGALGVSLLGMAFLNEVDRVDMRQGKLILQD